MIEWTSSLMEVVDYQPALPGSLCVRSRRAHEHDREAPAGTIATVFAPVASAACVEPLKASGRGSLAAISSQMHHEEPLRCSPRGTTLLSPTSTQ